MNKQFVTYEIALKLKELDFDEPCFGYYTPMKEWMMAGTRINPERHFHGCNWANFDNSMYFMYKQNSFGDRDSVVKNSEFTKAIRNVAVPLWQQVIDFLREKYLLHIEIQSPDYPNDVNFSWSIHKINKFGSLASGEHFDYYKVREQAILKAIELCQNKK